MPYFHCQADFLVIRILVYVYEKLGISFFSSEKQSCIPTLPWREKLGQTHFISTYKAISRHLDSIYVPEMHVMMGAIRNEHITFLSGIILKSKLAMMKFVKTLLLESVD